MVAASVSVGGQDRRWNHNTHYYPLILATVPAGCQRVLDVGCGEGMLARQLARRVPRVVGIDQDTTSIELARRQDLDGQIEFVRGDPVDDLPVERLGGRIDARPRDRPEEPDLIPPVPPDQPGGDPVKPRPRI